MERFVVWVLREARHIFSELLSSAYLIRKTAKTFGFVLLSTLFLGACSQVAIFSADDEQENSSSDNSNGDTIDEDAPSVSFTSITPGALSAGTSDVRIFGTGSSNTQVISVYSDSTCSTLMYSATPLEFRNVGVALSLERDATTRLHAKAKSSSGTEGECTHLVDFTHTSTPTVGIRLQTPSASPGNSSTPAFLLTVDGGGVFESDDTISLHAGPSCDGTALDIDEATVSGNLLDGLTSSSTVVTLAAASAQSAGASTYSVKRRNAEGDEQCSSDYSQENEQFAAYFYDNVLPLAPDFTGSSLPDGTVIASITPTISAPAGSVEAGATVDVTIVGGGGASCSTVADEDGAWSCTVSPALTGGAAVALTVDVEQTDVAGNTGSSDSFSLTLDTVVPGAPTIVSPAASATLGSGTVTVSGSGAEADATVFVSVDGQTASCSDTADGSGNWSCALDEILSTASYTVRATQTDSVGNGPSAADTVAFDVDLLAPSTVVTAGLSPANASLINDTTPTISGAAGSAEAGSTVNVNITGSGSASCSDVVAGDGSWSCTTSPALTGTPSAALTVNLSQTDLAGNVSASSSVNLTLDSVAAGAPNLASTTPTASSSINDLSPTVSGVAGSVEAGATVNVSLTGSGSASCSTTAAGDGSWSCTTTPDLSSSSSASVTISVTQTDAAGNTSVATDYSVTLDDSNPSAPVSPALAGGGTITNDTTPTIEGGNGSVEANATVNVAVTGDTTGSCSTTANGSGAWSCDVSALTGGAAQSLSVNVTQTDAAGNTSAGESFALTLDTVDPADPVISSPAASATVTLADVTLSGTAEMNATVTVTVDGESATCSDTANGVGAWSCTLDESLSNASYTARATQTDAAGNGPSGADTVAFTVDVDTTPPSALATGTLTPLAGAFINDLTPTISGPAGNAEAGATVDVSITGSGSSSCSTTAAGDGSWSCTTSPALSSSASATLTIEVNQTDVAGNAGPASDYDVTLDDSDPVAPANITPVNAALINDTTQTINGAAGSAEASAGIAVTVTGSGGSSCSATAAGDGSWTCDLSPALTGGASEALSVSVVQTDVAGNASTSADFALTLDTVDPVAPAISSPTASEYLDDGDVTVSGTSEANAVIAVSVDSETASCSTTANGAGAWSCALDETLTDGAYVVRVVQNDAAGNGPSAATTVSVNIDTDVPDAIVAGTLSPAPSAFTNDVSPEVSGPAGSAEAGATINVSITGSGTSSCSTTAAGDGSWSCTTSPDLNTSASATLTVSVTQTDAASNTSTAANYTVTLDNGDPVAPANITPVNAALINDTTQTISGAAGSAEASAGIAVTVTGSGGSSCSATAAGDGSWTCDLSPALTGGASEALSVSVVQTDVAGNASTSADFALTLDTVDPADPVISSPTASATLTEGDVTLSGTAEMNATITVTVDGESATCSDTANGVGAWSCTLDETLSNASYTARATQTDAAGNGPSGADTVAFTVDVDTTPPAALATGTLTPLAGAFINDLTPTISGPAGNAEAGATVDVSITGSGSSSCSTTAAGDGSWSCTTSPALSSSASATLTIEVNQTDVAGNASPASDYDVTLDDTAPDAPVSPGLAGGGSLTNGTTPTINGSDGSVEPFATVNVSVTGDATGSCSTTANEDGAWTCDVSTLTGGSAQSLTANITQTDAAGNTSVAESFAFTLDTVASTAPLSVSPSNGSQTKDTTPEISGAAGSVDANATVNVAVTGDATGTCSTTAAGDGSWACDVSTLSGGAAQSLSVSVTQTDEAGNESTATAFALTLDTVAPSAPDLSSVLPTAASLTNDTTPSIEGPAGSVEGNATVNVSITGSGSSSCSVTAAANGSWSCETSPALSGGAAETLTVSVTQTDAADNTSVADDFSLTLDTVAPSAPSSISPGNGALTNDVSPDFSGPAGSAEAGAEINLSITGGGDGICMTTAAGDGSWSCSVAPDLTGGASVALSVSATQTDAANNTSSAGNFAITLDTETPSSAPVISAPTAAAELSDGAVEISGTSEANATVAVTVDGETAGCSDTASGAGAWSCTLDETLDDGAYTIRASQTDAAGNGPSSESTVAFTIASGGEWIHQAYLKAPNTSNTDLFGFSTDISGDTLVVGAHQEDASTSTIIHGADLSGATGNTGNSGAAYVFKRSGDTWAHEAFLKAPNRGSNDFFGFSVGISSDTAVVGAHQEDSSLTSIIHGSDLSSAGGGSGNSGAVYVFSRTGSTWTHEAFLKAPNRGNNDNFGRNVSISGDTIVVGAHQEDSNTTGIIHGSDLSGATGNAGNSGAVYVFSRIGSTWSHQAYIKAPNAGGTDFFGYATAISGNSIAVGAYQEDSSTTSIIHGSDLSGATGSAGNSGAVYVFTRTGNTWEHEAFFKAPNAGVGDNFGHAVALAGNTLVVGVPQENSTTTSVINDGDFSGTSDIINGIGAAYVYKRSSGTWTFDAFLKPPRLMTSSVDELYFGHSVAVESNIIAVGATHDSSSSTSITLGADLSGLSQDQDDTGAVHVYRENSDNWEHEAYLKAPNGSAVDEFGGSVSISGNTIVVGSANEDSNSTSIISDGDFSGANDSGDANGAVYVFTLADAPVAPGIARVAPSLAFAGSAEYPNLSVDLADGGNFLASDSIEVFDQANCTGEPITFLVPSVGSDEYTSYSGSTSSSIALEPFTPDHDQTEGVIYTYSVRLTKSDGQSICSGANGDAAKQYAQYLYDVTPPGDVTISSPLDGGITNNTQFTVGGSGLETGATVAVTVTGSGTSSCSTSSDLGGGAWSCTLDSALSDSASATLTVTAEQEDFAGNTSSTPDSITLTLDTTDPTSPIISSPADSALLTERPITVSGTAEFGATIDVTVDGELAACSTTANGAGAWSCDLDQDIADASHTFRAVQTDTAGNGPSTADTVNVTVGYIVPYQWSLEAYLKAPNNNDWLSFGRSSSVSGDTIAVGAAGEDSASTSIIHGSDLSGLSGTALNSGAVYVFTRASGTWSHEAILKAPNADSADQFGYSVDVSGDLIAVGAHREDSDITSIIHGSDLSSAGAGEDDSGAVYVFSRDSGTWTHEAYLKAPNVETQDQFGWAVAISGNTIAVGSRLEDSNTTGIINGDNLGSANNLGDNHGAVYVFNREGSTWSHEAYLKAPNSGQDDTFGWSLDISGNNIVVGAVSENSTTTNIIHGSDLSASDNDGDREGAAYVFTRSGNTWTHEAYLKAPNAQSTDNFGYAVTIFGETIIVGATSEDSSTSSIIHGSDLTSANELGDRNGAAYVFTRSSGTWSHQAYLKAPNSHDWAMFGSGASLSGDIAVVGAEEERSSTRDIINGSDLSSTNLSATQGGAAYVFIRNGSTWSHSAYLKPPMLMSASEKFATSVSISGDTIVVSTPWEDSNTTSIIHGDNLASTNNSGFESGAAYVFTISLLPAAPGIALNSPASSPGTDETPSFTVDFSSESLVATDVIELYQTLDCGGEAIDFDEATTGNTQLSGSTASSVTLTVASADAQASGDPYYYSVKRTNADGYSVCSSANGTPAKQWVEYDYVP